VTARLAEHRNPEPMRIQELRLIRYGKFTDRTLPLPQQRQDIHLIVGPNEAGKSTVRSAISDWLFGIPMRTPLGFLHPMQELRIGGVIERLASAQLPAQSLAFDRSKGNKNTLRTPQDVALPDATLQPWLGALQAQAFNRMYALDHTTLVEGGAGILSAADDVGRMLFQSASGVEHLGAALDRLQNEAAALWAPRKSSTRVYYQALEAYDTATADVKQAVLRTKDWKAQHEALLETELALVAARQHDGDLRQQRSRLERIRRVRPMLLALDASQGQLEALLATGSIAILAENATPVLRGARQSMVLVQADLQRLHSDVALAQAALAQLKVDKTVLALAADVGELNERRLQFRAHRTDIVKRTEEVRLEWVRLQELAGGLGWADGSEEAVRQRLPAPPVRARIARLFKERAGLEQALRVARGALTERQQRISQAQTALAALAGGLVDPALAGAVDQALKLGDHEAALDELDAKLDDLSHAREAALAGLGQWRAEPAALSGMAVPEPTLVQSLIEQHRSDTAELQAIQKALADKAQEVHRLELGLQQLVREFQPVSTEQVADAREARDAEWQAIRLVPGELSQRAAHFEERLGDADQLADARLDRAQHEADRQAKADRVAQQRLDLQGQETRLQAVQARIDACQSAWTTLSSSCGLPQLALEMAPSWLHQRQAVLERVREQLALERQRQARGDAGVKAHKMLVSLLNASTPNADALSFSECLRQARLRLAQAEQALGQRKTLTQQLSDGQNSLVHLQTGVQAAQAAWNAWEQAWQAAAQAAGCDASAPADQVEAEVAVMQEIERLLGRVRSIRSERIDTMQADLDGLACAAAAIAERVGADHAGQITDDTVLDLVSRLEQARQAEAAFTDWTLRLNSTTDGLLATQQRELAVQASLAALMAAAGSSDMDALGVAIERSDRRRELELQTQRASVELSQSADGLSVEELRMEVVEIGPDELTSALNRCGQLAGEVVQQIADLSNRHGTQKTAFEVFDGKDAAARAEARRQEAISLMGDAAERYLKLHNASRLLKWAMEKFRETKQGPMLAKASARFNTLTGGSFARLLVDAKDDAPRLWGIRPDGQQVDVTGMSEGTRDQLYLALRLAVLELQVEQGLNLPLIADDLFINFDDTRTAAGLRVLGDLSQKMQIVFLTHHDHLVPLAKDVLGSDLNVVCL